MDSTKRFLKRKLVQEQRNLRHGLAVVVDNALIDEFLHSEVDWDSVQRTRMELDAKYEFEFNVEVSDEEIQQHLTVLENEFNDERFRLLLTSCRNEVLSAVVGPFGLGGIVSSGDKNGGNVTTIHNAKEKVYAREQDEYKREDYTRAKNSEGKSFEGSGKSSVGSEFTRSQLDRKQNLVDAYTGRTERGSDTSPDHVVSNSEFHKDGGFMLESERKADFATDTNNLASTRREINRSMNDYDKKEWVDSKQAKREQTNEEFYEVDRQRVNDSYEKGKATAKKHAPTELDKVKYYSGRMATTGAHEGAKMGTQQALGLVLCEFFKAIFDEIQDIYAKGYSAGFDDNRFFLVMKERLSHIARRVAAKWKVACVAFRDGFISGFLSNLVTVIINMFVRTGKRIVRVIREGFYSLLKAIKMLCFPPQGMTIAQAAHEASKLIAAGLAVIGGIAVEQHIDNMIKAAPWLEPFADILTAVLTGGLTGLATTFIAYAIDKIDIFKVNAHEKHEFVMGRLETSLDKMFAEGDAFVSELAYSY